MLKSLFSPGKLIGAVCFLLAVAGSARLAYQWCGLGHLSYEFLPPSSSVYSGMDVGFRVAVLRGEYSERFFEQSSHFVSHADYWRDLLKASKIPCDQISDQRLEQGLRGYRVLVLPAAVCLSEKEKASIRGFLAEGNGVVCTWATGARDEKGKWKGIDFLQELTDAVGFQFRDREPPWFVTFADRSPITEGVPAASRLQVYSPERLEASGVSVDGYWSTASFGPVDKAGLPETLGALLHNRLERGRVVWFGFHENSAVAGGNNRSILDSALSNAVAWAGQRVVAAVNPWPWGYPAAAIFALDLQLEYENAGYAAQALMKSGTKSTFFCSPKVVKGDRDLVRRLQESGELALQGDSIEDVTNRWFGYQLLRLKWSRWRVWWLGRTWVSGFHPVKQVVPLQTVRALAGSGFSYYMESGEPPGSLLPATMKVSQTWRNHGRDLTLVRLTRVTDDDLHFSPYGVEGLETGWTVRRALVDFGMINRLGGLYILEYHTQGLSAPEYSDVLLTLSDKFRAGPAWVTTAQGVAEWWAERSQLSVRLSGRGSQGLQLTLASNAKVPVGGAVVRLYPPEGYTRARVVSSGGSGAPPSVVADPENGRIQLTFAKLEPGGVYSYKVDFEP